MNIEENDIIILDDDNNYVISNISIIDDAKYFIAVDINNTSNIKYLTQEDNEMIEIEDAEIVKKIALNVLNSTDLDKLVEFAKKILNL